MKLLLITPPLVPLNTPYPATPYLTGYLRRRGHSVTQTDLGLLWVLRLFSNQGLAQLTTELTRSPASVRAKPAVAHFLMHAPAYSRLGDVVITILQGRDNGLAHRIAARRLLPEGPRFAQLGPVGHEDSYLDFAFGSMSVVDRARYFATLFFEDIADAIQQGIDPHFALARYAESLAQSPAVIDPLLTELEHRERITVRALDELTIEQYERHTPDVVGITLAFPGNVMGALRVAQSLRRHAPKVKIVWGGGWVSTELRELNEPRLFEWVDAVCYDDGEKPLELLLDHYAGKRGKHELLRTRMGAGAHVEWLSNDAEPDAPFASTAWPVYAGLPLPEYLGLIDRLNPMHRLWNDTRWNKLTVAHGCYWHQCSFCDLNLDYINRYEPLTAHELVDRIEAVMNETDSRGFHFVDEAAPPKALKAMARELTRRQLDIAWWGNIRFEESFTQELCKQLAESGCVAVTGGLEVASNRLLKLMRKGVTVEQVARVTKFFANAGIRVHAYLMYGFPTQTTQETVDSLEYVRQLFVAGCLDSAYWHRLSITVHSPLGCGSPSAERDILKGARRFARNDVGGADTPGVDQDMLGEGLHRAVYNYMLGLGLDEDLRTWFSGDVPRPRVARGFMKRVLATPA